MCEWLRSMEKEGSGQSKVPASNHKKQVCNAKGGTKVRSSVAVVCVSDRST